MNIVLTQAVANELKQKYTVLELDSMPHPDGAIPAFCVLPVESIAMEMNQLAENVELHETLIDAVKNNDCETAVKLCSQLQGKFGGELDSFYDEINLRVQKTNSTVLVLGQTFS